MKLNDLLTEQRTNQPAIKFLESITGKQIADEAIRMIDHVFKGPNHRVGSWAVMAIKKDQSLLQREYHLREVAEYAVSTLYQDWAADQPYEIASVIDESDKPPYLYIPDTVDYAVKMLMVHFKNTKL